MTLAEQRFCPRCGTTLQGGLPFCPKCGLDTSEAADGPSARAGAHSNPPVDALGRNFDSGSEAGNPPGARTAPDPQPIDSRETTMPRFLGDRETRVPIIVFGVLVVAVGLVMVGLLARPQPGGPGDPQSGPPGSAVASGVVPPALIVGLTIQSPFDGQAVATKEVTVIGLAPPGLTITRDVSLGLDQHATADGTGHWAINVSLDEGQNDLVFRIGDDRSTEKRLRVVFTPQAP